ncbi:GNAT family N-acetyltransferase [bacterium]|nr:GNAT family N-acetyltransferase [bacterium]
MKVLEVHDKKTKALFHKTLKTIYHSDSNYVYPLESDIEFVFNPTKNPAFNNGEAIRWVLLNTKGTPIGRVAAFYDLNQQQETPYPVGGMGFFECIDDEDAAKLLMDTAKNWLEAHGMKAMDGPINFGERDKFWGLLVDGFTQPTYLENYNPAYYRRFFENYGFRQYIEQDTYRIDRQSFDAKRFTKVAEWISRKPGFKFEHFRMAEVERFARDFVTVYNSAWEKFVNFKPITVEQVMSTMKAMKNILIEDFIWFGYVNNEPAGIMVMIPDVNQLLAHMEGKMTALNKLRFLYLKNVRKMTRAKGLVFGVVPKYRKYGVETVMIYRFYKTVSQTWQYNTVELSWVGKFNERMAALMQNINAHVAKKHLTYRYLFDDSLPFEPYKIKSE